MDEVQELGKTTFRAMAPRVSHALAIDIARKVRKCNLKKKKRDLLKRHRRKLIKEDKEDRRLRGPKKRHGPRVQRKWGTLPKHTPFEWKLGWRKSVIFPEVPSGAREAALRRCVGRAPELMAHSLAMNLLGEQQEGKAVVWPERQPEHGEGLDLRCPPKIMMGEKLFHEVARPAVIHEVPQVCRAARVVDKWGLRRWLYTFACRVWRAEDFEGEPPEEFLEALSQAVTARESMEIDAAWPARHVFALSTSRN